MEYGIDLEMQLKCSDKSKLMAGDELTEWK